ncbi:MAG TPA: helix-turn-helix transcriptional regulator [Candidatus Binatia bacterium]|nr:helix-turn-helix transcriptional regulator [Candidatus Binatia bacterium]
MRWLDHERERQGISLREVARRLGYRNATRVGQYFQQRIVAGPDMLVRLAVAVNVSPIDALWNARHYPTVLEYLNKLCRFGASWAYEDRVDIDSQGAIFTLQYSEIGFPPGGDLRMPPPNLRHRYHIATVCNSAGILRIISLPKPMACAILLAIALFQRRGDKLRPETTPFYEKLSFAVAKMIPAAEVAHLPSNVGVGSYKPIKDAQAVFQYRFYGAMRLAIVGEYMHQWCDFVCKNYAEYARLALYKQGGFLGEPVESNMFDEDIWKWQRTAMPSAEDFQIDENT